MVTSQQFINWLKSKGLMPNVLDNYENFEKIFMKYLKIRRRNELLIIGDLGQIQKRTTPIMVGCYLIAAKRLGLSYKLILQRPKKIGEKADKVLIKALDNIQDDSFLTISVSGKLGSMQSLGKSFRKLVRTKRLKFVSTLNLSELPTTKFHTLVESINVDDKMIQKNAKRLASLLDVSDEVRIRTSKGTNLVIGIRGMKAIRNDGDFLTKGGNIPFGEVYIPPRRNQVKGIAVIDGSVKTRYGTHIVKEPVRLRINQGVVEEIIGKGETAKKLRETLDWAEKKAKYDWGVRRIGELGIGINPNAAIVGPTILNEKTKGTAHIAIGSNAWFGGSIYSIIHLDQVFKDPQIWIDGKKFSLLD